MFCRLLDTAAPAEARGVWSIEVVDRVSITAGVRREHRGARDAHAPTAPAASIEITDCVPRFLRHGRLHQPTTIVRRVRRLAGSPRIGVRLRPVFEYGRTSPEITTGSTISAT